MTAEERKWWRRRLLYYTALCLVPLPVVFYFGPNVILFGKLTWITPADFAPIAASRCAPFVIAIKQYERDHGTLPDPAHWSPPGFDEQDRRWGDLDTREYHYWARDHHFIVYNLTGPDQHWSVTGPFTSGRIPLPSITLPPSTRPTTSPSH